MDNKRNEGRKQWSRNHPNVAATPSMKRRMVDHDYHGRGIYMITLCVEKRIPRLGALCGPDSCHSQPWVNLSSLGKRVEAEWLGIPRYYPQIKVLALTVMPDHLHGILFVTDSLPVHLGKVINGFKAGCNRAAREMGHPVPLWETGYTDGILRGKGQLDRWKEYLSDNPRRLWVKRQHHDFFTVSHHLTIAGTTVAAMGNHQLLQHPSILQQIVTVNGRSYSDPILNADGSVNMDASRRVVFKFRLNDEEIALEGDKLLTQGAVLVSPAVSRGEKAIINRALEAGVPVILISDNGFSEMAKPGGKLFDACAAGKLLLISKNEHHNDFLPLTQERCHDMNALARAIARQP